MKRIVLMTFVSILLLLFVLPGIAENTKYVKTLFSSNVRSGPTTNDAVIARVEEGQKFEMIEKIDGWYCIKLEDGTVGYIGETRCEIAGRYEIGDIVTYGNYEQDNDQSNGKEPIEWIVIKIDKANNSALLLSKYGLDAHEFDSRFYRGWKSSSIRSWLNGTFVKTAFTTAEQKKILLTTVKTEDNDKWLEYCKKHNVDFYFYVSGGEDTKDRIFFLSLDEAMEYGGITSLDKFYINAGSDKLKTVPTKYAVARGVKQHDPSDSSYSLNGEGCCDWWLRTPGDIDTEVPIVCGNFLSLSSVDYTNRAVRPAFWLDLN